MITIRKPSHYIAVPIQAAREVSLLAAGVYLRLASLDTITVEKLVRNEDKGAVSKALLELRNAGLIDMPDNYTIVLGDVPVPAPPPLPPAPAYTGRQDDAFPDASVQDVVDYWNAEAEKTGVPKCISLTAARRSRIRERLANTFWREHWREAAQKIKDSSFLCGHNDRKWKANIDWFIRPDTVPSILEGKYTGNTHRKATSHMREEGEII